LDLSILGVEGVLIYKRAHVQIPIFEDDLVALPLALPVVSLDIDEKDLGQ